MLWVESVGVDAFATLRGGGEFGENWHEAARGLAKQKVSDDFIAVAVAEGRIAAGHTTAGRLAVCGESNGGLAVTACMLQRPDRFATVVCHTPLTDMLRDATFTMASCWLPEDRDPADPAHLANLRGYSPLLQVEPGIANPAILFCTGDHDDRVVPAHPKKLATPLQAAAPPGSGPTLLRVQRGVGHGSGKPSSAVMSMDSDKFIS